ncbi:hypothetical protein F4823DRAFT_608603 [Ustulina deusta]|nr:hypothetical protein F4823DRAFT_608603 [Ustulina deusta]
MWAQSAGLTRRRPLATSRCAGFPHIPASPRSASTSVPRSALETEPRPQTLTEKIIQNHAIPDPGKRAAPRPGDYVSLSPSEPPRFILPHSSSTRSITTYKTLVQHMLEKSRRSRLSLLNKT